MKKIIVGTRGSKLAVTQTNWVINELKKKYPDIEFETKIIKTKGDKILDKPLDKIGDKGLFIKELEQALLDQEIDFAVHSMKDMPTDLEEEFILSKPPKREEPADVLITRYPISSLSELKEHAIIATGSKRRKYQLLHLRKDLNIVGLRGNINTRINKIYTENLDGIILAKAGLNRIDFSAEDLYIVELDKKEFIPAAAQGVLAIELLKSNADMLSILNSISSKETEMQVKAERTFLNMVGGGCHTPVGAYLDYNKEGSDLYYFYQRGEEVLKGSIPVRNDEIDHIEEMISRKVNI